MTERFSNFATTTLSGSINNSTTTITVTSAAAFPPTGNFRIIVDSELMKVTAVSGNDFTVVRASEPVNGSSTAVAHNNGALVTCVVTAEQLAAAAGTAANSADQDVNPSDIPLGAAGVMQDIASTVINPGTYFIYGQHTTNKSSTGSIVTRLYNATTLTTLSISQRDQSESGFLKPTSTGILVTVSAQTTIKLQASNNTGSATTYGTGGGTFTDPTALIVAIPINGTAGVTNYFTAKNEFYWPPPVKAADLIDLDAANQWWDKVATPTGGVVYTTATADAIATTYGDDLIKVVAAGSGDGVKTTWTYANEKRVKSGQYMAALCAVYIVTASRTATVSLVTSTPTTIASASISTVGSWVLVPLESGGNALGGSSVDFKVTLDGAGTFYVVPLGALVSSSAYPTAINLPLRKERYVDLQNEAPQLVSLTGAADPATWTDLDTTSECSSLATRVNGFIRTNNTDDSSEWYMGVRAKGASGAAVRTAIMRSGGASISQIIPFIVLLNDANIFQYIVDRASGSGTWDDGEIALTGYWEWE